MTIQVDWIDRNLTVDTFRIYRDTVPILDNALPAVLAEVPGNVFTYLDTTAPRNTLFHYRIAAVKGTDQTLSTNKPLANIPYTGPGPTKLIRGDYQYGLYGRMPIEDILSPIEFFNQMGLAGTTATVLTTAKYWIKLVVNAKILFIPDNALVSNLPAGIKTIYAAGAMYGNDPSNTWSAALIGSNGTVPQNKTVSRGEHVFLARLTGSRVGTLGGSAVPQNQVGGEWDQFFAPLYIGRLGYGTYVPTVPQLDDNLSIANQYCYTKDHTSTSGNFIVTRGGSTTQPDQLYESGLAFNAGGSSAHMWRPVLELII